MKKEIIITITFRVHKKKTAKRNEHKIFHGLNIHGAVKLKHRKQDKYYVISEKLQTKRSFMLFSKKKKTYKF